LPTNLISEQAYIRLAKPILKGNKDFNSRVSLYDKIDRILTESGLEEALKSFMVNREVLEQGFPMERADQLKFQRSVSESLRTNIARLISRMSFREFAVHLADSHTLQYFCGYDRPSTKIIPSKSKLHDLSKLIPVELINKIITGLSAYLSGKNHGLGHQFDTSSLFADSTCLELNIHHPVDWVLLKDAVITIMKSIKAIRRSGLKHRMSPPEEFMKKVNKVSMAMTMTKPFRQDESKKERKRLFRELKSLLKICQSHGHRYLKLLQLQWQRSVLSEKQAEQISARLLKVLDQVDLVIHQAHERIIGERQIRNKDKILSLYENHARVYKRSKAGADTEFGLQLFIAESIDGLIVNWNMHQDVPVHDSKFVKPCIEALSNDGHQVKMFCGDRGFYSKRTSAYLKKKNITDHICPKNRKLLTTKLRSKKFRSSANRRSQTEGRIGVLKNKFLNGHLNTKGFDQQKVQVAWAILTHNLWVAARKIKDPEEIPLLLAS
jgi:hypothetical protein